MKKLILLIAGALCFLLTTIQPVYANDTKTVEISYKEPANIIFYDDGITIQEKVYCGELLKEPSHVERDGYRFLGWYIKDTDVKWNFSDPVTDNLELESRFEEIKKESEKEDTGKKEDKQKNESSPDSSSDTSTKNSNVVNTSVQTYATVFGILFVCSLGGICFLIRKRGKND